MNHHQEAAQRFHFIERHICIGVVKVPDPDARDVRTDWAKKNSKALDKGYLVWVIWYV